MRQPVYIIHTIEAMADKIPGTIPAASISATETCAKIAYNTKNVDGGIIEPNVPATATSAVAIDAGNPAARISETDSRAIVAAVPIEDPDTAEKPAEAATVAIPSPPGNRPRIRSALLKT